MSGASNPVTSAPVNLTSNTSIWCQLNYTVVAHKGGEAGFGILVAVGTFIILTGLVLNSLVIYFANQNRLTGSLAHLNTVVKHLAVSDLMFALLACPFFLTTFQMTCKT